MLKLPRVAIAACVVALLMAAQAIFAAASGQVAVLPFALIPLFSAIGILRRRVWSAYGYALFVLAQLALMPYIVRREGTGDMSVVVAGAVIMAAQAALFLAAGVSLKAAGAVSGRAAPWLAVAVLGTLPVVFVQAFVIPTGSMEDTLVIGDRVLVRRFPKPAIVRGQVVVFRYPVDPRQTQVKRVVGMPGDRIRLVNKKLLVNGAAVAEPYATNRTGYTDLYRDNFPSEPNSDVKPFDPGVQMLAHNVVGEEVLVPAGKYFVLGDNRDSSLDSRYFGFIAEADVIGTPFLIYDSQDATASRTRWSRLFRLI